LTRLLVLCTHNSARSQMMEGWLRRHAREAGVALEVWSAGTERTRVKPDAITVMTEVGVDLSAHRSKALTEVPDPWSFEVVLTVCDDANEACPAYPAATERRHVGVPDPSGRGLREWREVRDGLGRMSLLLVAGLGRGRVATDSELADALAAEG
jgi:arsenate reductase